MGGKELQNIFSSAHRYGKEFVLCLFCKFILKYLELYFFYQIWLIYIL